MTSPIALIGCTGSVGEHVRHYLRQHNPDLKLHILSRNQAAEITENEQLFYADLEAWSSLDEDCLTGCKRAVVILPQALSAEEMVEIGKQIGDRLHEAGTLEVVRVSSFGIDSRSSSSVCSQGPLGEAHATIEAYYSTLGLAVCSVRPTSFFSNFQFSEADLRSRARVGSPLGSEPSARVNWVANADIGSVVGRVAAEPQLDAFGSVLDITGPAENTYSSTDFVAMLQSHPDLEGRTVLYEETPLPPGVYGDLWGFLRAGGFGHHTDGVERVLGRKPLLLKDHVREISLAAEPAP